MKRIILIAICCMLATGCGPKERQEAPEESIVEAESSQVQQVDSTQGDTGLATHQSLDPTLRNIDSDVVEIKEKMFIAQTNDVYLNPEDYLGKTFRYEGIMDIYTYEGTGDTFYSVIRYGPGCCGYDSNAGFEVIWDGEYPDNNAWVEVTGTLEKFNVDEYEFLRLRVSSFEEKSTRGAEYVNQ